MIPQRFEPIVFGLVLSGLMSAVVAAVSTAVNRGISPGFAVAWAAAWASAWLLAFPVVLVLGPATRRVVRLVIDSNERMPGRERPGEIK